MSNKNATAQKTISAGLATNYIQSQTKATRWDLISSMQALTATQQGGAAGPTKNQLRMLKEDLEPLLNGNPRIKNQGSAFVFSAQQGTAQHPHQSTGQSIK